MFQETTETFGKPQLVPPFLTCTDTIIYTQGIAIPGSIWLL